MDPITEYLIGVYLSVLDTKMPTTFMLDFEMLGWKTATVNGDEKVRQAVSAVIIKMSVRHEQQEKDWPCTRW